MARKRVSNNISYDNIRDLYYVTLNYGVDQAGKRIKKTETFKTKKEAKDRLIEFEGEKLKNNIVIPRNDTIADWLDYWMQNVVKVNREQTTYAGYNFIITKHIKPAFRKIKLQELTPKMLQEYYTTKQTQISENGKKPLSSNTVKKHHILLKTALKFAQMQGAIAANPADKVSPPQYMKPEISFYMVDHLKELFGLIETDYILKPAVYLAGTLGLRRGEITGLKWENVDFENRILHIKEARVRAGNEIIVKKTKNITSTRKLAMSTILYNKLCEVKSRQEYVSKSQPNDKDYGYVVVDENGDPINPAYLSARFGKFIRNNGLPHITLHGLRHSIASIGNEVGLTLYDISKILGHSSIDTTVRTYMHTFDDTHREGINKINDILK